MEDSGWDSGGETASATFTQQQNSNTSRDGGRQNKYDNRQNSYGDRQNSYGDRQNTHGDRQNNYGDRRGGSRQTFTNSNWRNKASNNQRDDESSERATVMEVKSNLVGKIIGRGGSNIRLIEEQSQAKVKIDKNSDPSGQQTSVSLIGTPEAQAKAKEMILALFNDEPQRRSNNDYYNNPQSRGRDNQSNDFSQDETQDYDWQKGNQREDESSERATVMEVKSNLVGKIIGRGGSNIRLIEEQSQAKIKIDKNSDPSGEQTSVSLIGTSEAQAKAKEMILALFNDEPQRRSNNDFYNNPQSHGGDNQSYNEPQEDNQVYDWEKVAAESRRRLEESWAKLPPILKDFYIEDPEVAGMSARDVTAWRLATNNISVNRVTTDATQEMLPIPNPVITFEQAFAPYPEILDQIYKQDFKTPSPIQSQAWPILLSGQDMIGIAQTGTGKTLAFILPALIHIEKQPIPMEERLGPNVLVLAPTRELAIQIEREVSKYHYRGIKSVCVYGGGSRKDQINTVAKGVQIVIATPGRLNDLVMAKHLNVETITYLVLDEADRMLDMGFGPQIRISLLNIRPDKQTIMTSATWPALVQRLAASYMKNPVQVVVGTLDLAAVHSVKQDLLFVNDDVEEKFQILVDFFRAMDPTDKVIVFCGRRATAIAISTDLAMMGIHYQSIYGGLDQCDREQALEDMRTGEANILIATDIASRGIDIENITHIINFDFPHNLEEFVHRVGRTGRAGRSGNAITYISRRDWANAEGLIDILKEAGQEIPDELVNMAERFNKKKAEMPAGGRGGRFGRGRRY